MINNQFSLQTIMLFKIYISILKMKNIQPAIFLVPLIVLILVVGMYFSLLKSTTNKNAFKSLVLVIAVLAFLLNFVWEVLQLPLYKDAAYDREHIAFCALASVADALMVLLLYLCFALINKKPFWAQDMGFPQVFALMIIGGIGAIIAEMAHTAAGNWTYADSMPILPVVNAGLLPVLQFLLLPALIYYVSFLFLKKISKNETQFINL